MVQIQKSPTIKKRNPHFLSFLTLDRTPLHYLCRKKEAASFVKSGRDTTKQRQQNKKDSESYFGVLENLINSGISVDSRNYMGETPLMQAAAKGNEEAVRFLLEHKADIKVTNKYHFLTLLSHFSL